MSEQDKPPATCDSCGDPLDVDGDRSYHICAVCAESGCFPGTTRNPSPLIEVDAPGEKDFDWKALAERRKEDIDGLVTMTHNLEAQLAEERAKGERCDSTICQCRDIPGACDTCFWRPVKGDGSEEHPFIDQFSGKAFARKDYAGREFSFGICERDDGYEITVIPVREGPTRYYRLNPDGTIDDLARLAEPAQAAPDATALREAADRAVAWHGYDASEREQKGYNPDYVPIWEQELRAVIMRSEPRKGD